MLDHADEVQSVLDGPKEGKRREARRVASGPVAGLFTPADLLMAMEQARQQVLQPLYAGTASGDSTRRCSRWAEVVRNGMGDIDDVLRTVPSIPNLP
jgi:hypothetical protein